MRGLPHYGLFNSTEGQDALIFLLACHFQDSSSERGKNHHHRRHHHCHYHYIIINIKQKLIKVIMIFKIIICKRTAVILFNP